MENAVASDEFRVSIPDVHVRMFLIEEHKLEFIDITVAYGDIKEIKELNCTFRSIQSLEGVLFFTALTYLDCSFNRLTSLDVSQNTDLTKLNCNSSYIKSLDVSQNTALEVLNLERCCFQSLDVSQNTALEVLNLKSCMQLKSLDVSQNTALEVLNCNWNNIKSLDVSQNTALKVLNCNWNVIESLDISQNTALEVLNLERCWLQSLDVSQNTALEVLNCAENQLTSLDLSNNPSLEKVILKGNPGDWWEQLEEDEEVEVWGGDDNYDFSSSWGGFGDGGDSGFCSACQLAPCMCSDPGW